MLFAEQVTRKYTLNQGSHLYEKDASDTKVLGTTRLSKEEHLPPLVSSTNPSIDDDDSNDRYQSIKLRLTGKHFPHRQLHCKIIYQKTYSKQSISQVKHFLFRNDTNSPPFFHNGSRKAQILHCKLRLGISD